MILPRRSPWLVIGANGFLGSALLAELAAVGAPAVGARGPGFLPLDLLDPPALERVLRQVRPQRIVNAAGHPPGATDEEMCRLHLKGSRNLLAAVEESGLACRTVLLGSAAEYGNSPESAGSDESDPPRPLSAYGRIKARQSEAGLDARNRGVDVVIVRLFNTTGPGQGAHLLAGALLARLARGERPLRVGQANFVRDWLDVRDAARALVRIGEAAASPQAVNVCSGEGRTVEDLARTLAELAGGQVEPTPAATPAEVLWRSVGRPDRLRALGWRPEIPFAQSLHDQWRASGSPRQQALGR
jgi:GDP-4-dehydro-6-deoxy-D-mannose reductase